MPLVPLVAVFTPRHRDLRAEKPVSIRWAGVPGSEAPTEGDSLTGERPCGRACGRAGLDEPHAADGESILLRRGQGSLGPGAIVEPPLWTAHCTRVAPGAYVGVGALAQRLADQGTTQDVAHRTWGHYRYGMCASRGTQ